jgi:triosephosphate isomerase
MRPRIVAGNWKMNTNRGSAMALAAAIAKGAPDGVTTVVCPPFPYLECVGQAIAGSKVALGAQDCHYKDSGAYTSSVSPQMLLDVGCTYVIIGHSERRHGLGEQEGLINFKTSTALRAGLHVILCVGETLEEREENRTAQVFYREVASGLAGLNADELSRLLIAYEPIWAIGTGKVATPQQAQEVHQSVRRRVRELFTQAVGDNLPLLYGGSVKGDNAAELFAQTDVDGGLIGGASLKADEFLKIANAAKRG